VSAAIRRETGLMPVPGCSRRLGGHIVPCGPVPTLIYSKIGGRLASMRAMEKHSEEAVWRCQQNITSFRAQLTRETKESRRATLASPRARSFIGQDQGLIQREPGGRGRVGKELECPSAAVKLLQL
jgi:hypothetical protein